MKSRTVVYLESVVCPRRDLDSSRLVNYFLSNHCRFTKNPAKASVLLVMTCGFHQTAVRDSLEAIGRLKKFPGELIVLGCLPGTHQSMLAQMFTGKSLSVRNIEGIDAFFPAFKVKYAQTADGHAPPDSRFVIRKGSRSQKTAGPLRDAAARLLRRRSQKRRHAQLRISTGCLGKCSYCAIRRATGSLKSKPPDACLEEYRALLRQGADRISFVGEDVGAYGLDIGSSLPELFSRLNGTGGPGRAKCFFTTIAPSWIIAYHRELTEFVRSGDLGGLEIAFQTGSERVLRLMNRRADVERLVSVILDLRKVNPGFWIKGEFMVGFPSESDEDFEATLDLIRRVRPDKIWFAKYYDAEGIEASSSADKVPEEVKERRAQRLRSEFTQSHYFQGHIA